MQAFMKFVFTVILFILLISNGVFFTGFENSPFQPQPAYAYDRDQFEPYSPEPFAANGALVVSVLEGSQWREAGSLSFDKYLREREIDLGGFSLNDGVLKLRLVQKGGASAHIDAAFLGGGIPVRVNGEEGFLLNKLSRRDYDVINVDKNGIELEFPANAGNESLAVTARIEDLVISQVPFQFPLENTGIEMNENASFYTYYIDSEKKEIKVDGSIDEVTGRTPFMKEKVFPGSGHPPGFIYVWVANDEENLYVTFDVTPDNTMDGDKDYAKVYVKKDSGLKEFKVSVPETRWGLPAFTYTDKVAYQHKVYEFAIPLSELDIAGGSTGEALPLAFSAYGTMAYSPNKSNPRLACDPSNNRYLLVYEKTDPGWNNYIYGKVLDSSGNAVVGEFKISDESGEAPSLAYDNANQKYLVIWEDTVNSSVYGQFVNVNGSKALSNFPVSSVGGGSKQSPSVAWDNVNNRFLVVWHDSQIGSWDIYGRLVDTVTGAVYGDSFPISTAVYDQVNPLLAFDSERKKFLVAWCDYRNSPNPSLGQYKFDIYGQLVNANGTLDTTGAGTNLAICDDNNRQEYPSVASMQNGKFLVSWQDDDSTDVDIMGRIVNAQDGSTPTGNFIISDAGSYKRSPSVAYDSANGKFLSVWEDYRNGDTDIYGQFTKPDGTPEGSATGENLIIYKSGGEQRSPAVVYNPNAQYFLTAFEKWEVNPHDIGLKRVFARDDQVVAADKAELTFNVIKGTNVAPEDIASNLSLPAAGSNGSAITWSSSDTAVISNAGVVTHGQANQTVVMTATLAKGSVSDTVAFNLTVVALDQTGTTERVSVHSNGTQGNDSSCNASISSDGRYVAFYSYASNLVDGDTNGAMDIFVHDRQSLKTVRVSVSTAGVQGNSGSRYPVISAGGRYVVFWSGASNLVPGDTNGAEDVFLHDRDADGDGIFDEPGAITTERIDISSSGAQAANGSYNGYATVSADGRYIAFRSDAANLVPGDTNGRADIFVRDRQNSTTTRVSVSTSGAQSDSDCYEPVISSDGRYVAFSTSATTLEQGITDFGIYIHDLHTGATVWAGVPEATDPSLSASGRYVAFESSSWALVSGDTNGHYDIFVLDRDADGDGIFDEGGGTAIERISLSTAGVEPDNNCYGQTISADGRYVAFFSQASTLVPGDSNGAEDIFVNDCQTHVTRRLSLSSAGVQGNGPSFEQSISAGERYVAFTSDATNLVAGDTNGQGDIFVRDWQEAIDSTPPSWPLGSSLTASNVGNTSLTLSWQAATDNIGVTGYRVYKNAVLLGSAGGATSYNVTSLTANTQYTFKVEAGDAAGNWSSTGPSIVVTTSPAKPQVLTKFPAGTGTYTLTIPAGALKDEAGNPLSGDYILKFTTK